MQRSPPLSKEFIESTFFVDSDAGKLYWKNPPKCHNQLIGCEAGTSRNSGAKKYWSVRVNGRLYKRSYLVFTFTTGIWPQHLIDHINGDSLDDRALNLRQATIMQNNWNIRRKTKEQQLPMGVRNTASGRFCARICVNKITIHLGAFDSVAEASAVYIDARKRHFGEFSGV